MQPSAEFKLLLDCCRAAFARAPPSAIAVDPATIDWERFVRLARFHRVQAIAWNSLAPASNALPVAQAETLAEEAAEIAAANLRAAVEAGSLRDHFVGAGVDLLFLKGLTTATLAYRAPLLKVSADLDLLVDPADIDRAAELLEARGFAPMVPRDRERLSAWHHSRKESLWRRADGIQIDLHSRLADNRRLIAGLGLASPRQDVIVAPGIALPTLAEQELVAYLCVHGASSAWFRLKWISDLAGILYPWRDLERLHEQCRRLGAGRAASQALLLIARLFDVDPDKAARDLRADWQSRLLARSAARQLALGGEPRAPTETPFGTARIHWTQLLLMPGAPFKLGEGFRQIRDAVANRANRRRTKSVQRP